jgi:hypothetical protein
MTSTQKLAEIIKQYVVTPQGPALDAAIEELRQIHAAEQKELDQARDDIAALQNDLQGAEVAYAALHQDYVILANRVTALEARNTDDDSVVDEALKGFTGQPNPGGAAPSAGGNPVPVEPAPAPAETAAVELAGSVENEPQPAEPVAPAKAAK